MHNELLIDYAQVNKSVSAWMNEFYIRTCTLWIVCHQCTNKQPWMGEWMND